MIHYSPNSESVTQENSSDSSNKTQKNSVKGKIPKYINYCSLYSNSFQKINKRMKIKIILLKPKKLKDVKAKIEQVEITDKEKRHI